MNDSLPLAKTRSRPLVRRQRRVVAPNHLAYVASLPCCVCGKEPPSTVHHLRCLGSSAAAGRRAGDDETLPLCAEHHQGDTGVHKRGEITFWMLRGIVPLVLAARLWAESHGEAMP